MDHTMASTDKDPFLEMEELHTSRSSHSPLKDPQEEQIPDSYRNEASAYPGRPWFIFVAVLAYICLALFTWTVTCVLSFRPIVYSSYHSDITKRNWQLPKTSVYNKNVQWFRAARVIQSIVSVLAVPLTSAVCAKAAVAFVQRSPHRTKLTLRQTIALADKGWASPTVLLQVGTPKGVRRIGSLFLLIAVVINALGVVVTPLQEIFLRQKTMKVPNKPSWVRGLNDLQDTFGRNDISPQYGESVTVLRHALESTSSTDLQPHLWTNQTMAICTRAVQDTGSIADYMAQYEIFCGVMASLNYLQMVNGIYSRGDAVLINDINPLQNETSVLYPFVAQLPSNFSTGVLQQFVPRINSSASYGTISKDDFPSDCQTLEGSFYAHYANASDGWTLTACMPDDQRVSPWKASRKRQEFRETLFVNVSGQYFKATVDTTAGYFELPNYANGQQFGDILDQDPNELCGSTCPDEGGIVQANGYYYDPPISNPYSAASRTVIVNPRPPPLVSPPLSEITNLAMVRNKGPLLNTALALFDKNSFIAQSKTAPTDPTNAVCTGTLPFGPLAYLPCINGTQSASSQVATWLELFTSTERSVEQRWNMSVLLTQAAFVSNDILLTWQNSSESTMMIYYDLGSDTQVPVISSAGIIVVSILLAAQLLGLSLLALYACRWGLWTSSLDAFTMLRLGAVVGPERIPLWVAKDTDRVTVLDDIPGWVGDAAEDEMSRRLALGARTEVKQQARYRSY